MGLFLRQYNLIEIFQKMQHFLNQTEEHLDNFSDPSKS